MACRHCKDTEVLVTPDSIVRCSSCMSLLKKYVPPKPPRVFLGGTCQDPDYRNLLIPLLEAAGIQYFNPVVADWDERARRDELIMREQCDFCLYVITPQMKGIYSIAEVVDDSNKRPDKTVFCFVIENEKGRFTEEQIKSLKAVADMILVNGATICWNFEMIPHAIASKWADILKGRIHD